MKLKYYLRGLGIGMLAAAFILLLFSNRGKETLSEQEIIKKAEALGMVKEEELLFRPEQKEEAPKETTEKGQQEEQPENTEDGTVSSNSPEEEQQPEADGESEQTEETGFVPENVQMQPVPDTAEDMEVASNGYEVRFRISQGTYGEKLSFNLQKSGLIEDWVEFSDYLTSNGYSVKLMTGTYTIPLGSTYEQIAQTITSKSRRDVEE